MQHHNYSLDEIDRLIPWEKEVYLTMLQEWIKEQNAQQQQMESRRHGSNS
jgi:hypothetical protein